MDRTRDAQAASGTLLGLAIVLQWLSIFLLLPSTVFAASVVLDWDPSTDANLAGYKVYYQANSASLPFSGTGAADGSAPIVKGIVTTTTVSGLDPNNSYYFAVTAYNSTGSESVYSNIIEIKESVAPVISVTSPANNASVGKTVTISANASDNVGVTKVQFFVNGTRIAESTTAPFACSWDTSSLTGGVYTISAKAFDAAGNEGDSANISVTVSGDTLPPVVSLTASAGSATAGENVVISVSASDNVGVARMEIYLDGSLVLAGNQSPIRYNWNTAAASIGSHVLNAKAYDAAGNVGLSAGATVSVLKAAVTASKDTEAPSVALASVAPGLNGTVVVTAGASDNVGVARVELYVDDSLQATLTSAPYSFNWNDSLLANGVYTLSVRAYDAAGNVGRSADMTLTVFNDTTAPVVAIDPISTLSSATSLAISGSVSDDTALASVTVQVGSDSANPVAVTGNSWSFTLTGLAIGDNLVTVRATDRAGNSSTATASVIVLDPAVATMAPAASDQASLTLLDAQRALQIASGTLPPTSELLARLDVAPYIDGMSRPNGMVDSGDVMVILLKLVGKL